MGAAGSTGTGDSGGPLAADTLMRISSNTKPMVAVLVLSLVEQAAAASMRLWSRE